MEQFNKKSNEEILKIKRKSLAILTVVTILFTPVILYFSLALLVSIGVFSFRGIGISLLILVPFTILVLREVTKDLKQEAKLDEIVQELSEKDLTKDESFNVEDYPAIANDYSLQVIQIAESVNGELFVYVYQPSDATKDLTATTIRMSQSIGENAKWRDYDLTLLSTEGVLDKYRVEGITILSDVVRYYDIAAIHRAFDENAHPQGAGTYQAASTHTNHLQVHPGANHAADRPAAYAR